MKPLVSIIIPTYNSQKTLAKTLESIYSQILEKKLIEIIIIDGGSNDNTKVIAGKFGCKIYKNTEVQQEYAKHKGILKSKGKYLLFLDSDEYLENIYSIKNRLNAFEVFKKNHILFSGGYKTPPDSVLINEYISLFGDPFAYFMYGVSPNENYFIKDYKLKYPGYIESDKFVLFKFGKNSILPLIDLCAGLIIEKASIFSINKNFRNDITMVPKIPYLIMSKFHSIVIMKNDPVIHESADTTGKFLNKLRWRIIVNIHYKSHPGTGFSNRDEYQPLLFKLKKYIFIPYGISFIGPFLIALYFLIVRKRKAAILHPFLTFYVSFFILYYHFLKVIGIKPKLFIYGHSAK